MQFVVFLVVLSFCAEERQNNFFRLYFLYLLTKFALCFWLCFCGVRKVKIFFVLSLFFSGRQDNFYMCFCGKIWSLFCAQFCASDCAAFWCEKGQGRAFFVLFSRVFCAFWRKCLAFFVQKCVLLIALFRALLPGASFPRSFWWLVLFQFWDGSIRNFCRFHSAKAAKRNPCAPGLENVLIALVI